MTHPSPHVQLDVPALKAALEAPLDALESALQELAREAREAQ